MVFSVKFDAFFTRKTRIIVDRQNVDIPPSITYASVVSRDSVIIVLLLSDISGIVVKCANVQNNYLNDNPKERVCFYSGEESGKY